MTKHLFMHIGLILWIACPSSGLKGFTYECFSYGYFTPVHILTVDPKEHPIMPVKAAGRETVRTLAEIHGAPMAINGGFWKLNGRPAGILKIHNVWYGTSHRPRGAIGWSLNGEHAVIDRVITNSRLKTYPDESEIDVVPMSTSPDEWKDLDHIVAGAPVLIKNGSIPEDFTLEQTRKSFLFNKHPRTAIGIKDNGDWVFVVVDGRFFGFLGGMTVRELARLMLSLGCVEALNLDGGASSTMIVNGNIINNPAGKHKEYGKRVEPVSDAILIFPSLLY